ncbi:hypothetical protein LMH87_009623 [Akanthomyces muscarius]|uniref:Uncharacterized protein n=1 Tax=Akanthomyces muscarius TaxID=2231603 RepID=A0A9W8QED0_AKAMU|nr:hypothetical protein LMH87_009623 [Akanthomyces muscarius]KAJ4153119.1 hypothetical protein LMH87_009623 [Akanthomyces muscarius]
MRVKRVLSTSTDRQARRVATTQTRQGWTTLRLAGWLAGGDSCHCQPMPCQLPGTTWRPAAEIPYMVDGLADGGPELLMPAQL